MMVIKWSHCLQAKNISSVNGTSFPQDGSLSCHLLATLIMARPLPSTFPSSVIHVSSSSQEYLLSLCSISSSQSLSHTTVVFLHSDPEIQTIPPNALITETPSHVILFFSLPLCHVSVIILFLHSQERHLIPLLAFLTWSINGWRCSPGLRVIRMECSPEKEKEKHISVGRNTI